MFDKVYGHERIKTMLARMVKNDCLHHGLCFSGPSGIGKRLLATEVARAMLCADRTGCGQCRHCQKFTSGNHPDFKMIVPDGNDIKVDQVREITENLHFKPFEGSCRIIVLDQVERFREESANAFLKSLEEPPDYVFFILVTSDLKALLPTIRSRCQTVAFQTLKEEDKCKILQTVFGKPEAMAQQLASISFRQLETDEEAWKLFCEDMKGIVTYLKMMLDHGHGIDFFVDLLKDKQAFPRFLDHLTATLRELSLNAAGVPPQPLFQPFREDLDPLISRCSKQDWRTYWEAVVRLNGERRRNLNLPLWFNATSVSSLGILEKSEENLKRRLAGRH